MRTVVIAAMGLTLVGCSGYYYSMGCGGGSARGGVVIDVEVTTPPSTEAREAIANAVLADLPHATLIEHLRRRLPQAVLNAVTVSTRTRTVRTHPAGGETQVHVVLQCEVSHRDQQNAANEVADACLDELEAALKARSPATSESK